MKLYMQRDAFHWGGPMPLRDKSGRTRYTVTSDAYAPGKRLHVTDLAGRKAVYIHQAIPSLFPKYEIEVYGRPVGAIVKDLSYFRPRYVMESLEWEVLGALAAYDYEITWQNTAVAACRPGRDERSGLLELEFYDRTEELSALGVILAINCALAPQESRHI